MLAIGLPTILERPTTTTSAPLVSTPARTIISWIPAGVQGGNFTSLTTDHQPTHIDRVKTVHVLIRINGIQHFFFIDVLGQRKLHQNPVNGIVVVVLFD